MKPPAKPKVPPPASGNLPAWQRKVAELSREIHQIKQWQQQPNAVYGTAQRMINERIIQKKRLEQRIAAAEKGLRAAPAQPKPTERQSAPAQPTKQPGIRTPPTKPPVERQAQSVTDRLNPFVSQTREFLNLKPQFEQPHVPPNQPFHYDPSLDPRGPEWSPLQKQQLKQIQAQKTGKQPPRPPRGRPNEYDPFTRNVRGRVKSLPEQAVGLAQGAGEGLARLLGVGNAIDAAKKAAQQYEEAVGEKRVLLSENPQQQEKELREISALFPVQGKVLAPYMRAYRRELAKLPPSQYLIEALEQQVDLAVGGGGVGVDPALVARAVPQEEYDRLYADVLQRTLGSIQRNELIAAYERALGKKLTPAQRKSVEALALAEQLKLVNEGPFFAALSQDVRDAALNYGFGKFASVLFGAAKGPVTAFVSQQLKRLPGKGGAVVRGATAQTGKAADQVSQTVRRRISPVVREAFVKTLDVPEHLAAGVSEATIQAFEIAGDRNLTPEEKAEALKTAFVEGAKANLGIEAILQGLLLGRHLGKGGFTLKGAELSRLKDAVRKGEIPDPDLARLHATVRQGEAKGAQFGVVEDVGLVEVGAEKEGVVRVRPVGHPEQLLRVSVSRLRRFTPGTGRAGQTVRERVGPTTGKKVPLGKQFAPVTPEGNPPAPQQHAATVPVKVPAPQAPSGSAPPSRPGARVATPNPTGKTATGGTPADATSVPELSNSRTAVDGKGTAGPTGTWEPVEQPGASTSSRRTPGEGPEPDTARGRGGEVPGNRPGAPEPEGNPAKATGSRRRRPAGGTDEASLTGTAAIATTRAAARSAGRTAPSAPTGTPAAGSIASTGAPPSAGGAPPTGGPPRGAPPGAPGQPQPRTTTAPAQKPGAVGVSGSGRTQPPTAQSPGAPPGPTPDAPASVVPNQQQVEREIDAVVERLKSGGRKGNASRSFTRAGDEQRLRDLRQERQDLVRGRGGRFRVGEPVVGTRHNGKTEALVYDGMASDTHAFVKDPRTGKRRAGTVPVERLRLPEPGVPSSRRAKHHARLDAAEAVARQKLAALRASRRGGKLASGLGGFNDLLEEAPHWIEIGAVQLARGLVEFDAWSRRMLEELGDELRATGRNVDELLREIWNASRKVHDEDTRKHGKQASELIVADEVPYVHAPRKGITANSLKARNENGALKDLEAAEESAYTDSVVFPWTEGDFKEWFDSASTDDFMAAWTDKAVRLAIERRIRHPGGLHEWLMTARANKFKEWGTSISSIHELRTRIVEVEWVNPPGHHGGKGSGRAHREILKLIDSSATYSEYVVALNRWADNRLKGGRVALPVGLQIMGEI